MLPVNDRTTGPLEMTGGETLIGFDFKVLAATDLAVWRWRGGAIVRLQLNTDYTVTGVGAANGGDVVLTTAALADDVVVVEGLRPTGRSADIAYERALPPATLNGEYDSLQAQVAELRRDVDRAIKVSRFADTMPATELPPVEPGKAIGFDDAGNLDFVAGAGGGGAIPDPLPVADGGTGATTAAQARVNLGLGALATKSAVGAGDLASEAVEAAKIKPKAVTAAKLDDGVAWWTVESATLAVPPASPSDGQAWLVPSGASGVWAAHVNKIAVREAGAWVYRAPVKGWLALALDDRRSRHYTGATWNLLTVETLSGRVATAIPANRFGGGLTRAAIVNGRHVMVWGDGAGVKNGVLGGRDVLLPETIPFESPPVTPLKRLVSGDGIHFVIDGADDVWSAGDGHSGCLAHGNINDVTRFKRIDALYSAGIKIRDVIVGRPGSSDLPVVFFVTTTDTAWACGRGDSGERGDGTTTATTSTPSQVLLDGGSVPLANIDTISVGSYPHTVAARRKDGTFCRWGYNGLGQLGLGDTTNRSKAVPHATLTGIAEVLAVSDTDGGNILVRTTGGLLHGAGRNSEGQLAQGADLATKSSFVSISHSETFKRVFGGPGRYGHFGGITATDKWVTWGYNGFGQVGDGTTTQRATIFQPTGAWQGSVTDAVVAGENTFQATYLMAGGALYAAGYNAVNNCCNGVGAANVTTFTALVGLEPGATIAAWGVYGNSASYGPLLLTTDGRLFAGGAGAQGELGWMPSSPAHSAVMQEVLIRGLRGQGGDPGTGGTAGRGYGGTSATAVTIGTGSKSLTTQANLAYEVGALVRIASTAPGEAATHWMYGDVTAYDVNTGAMTVNVIDQLGTGASRSAWSVSIAGRSGDVTPAATAAATAAANSAAAAATSATNAAASASSASSSAATATSQASAASTSASNAATSATNAASSASAAATSATNAASSATSASNSASTATSQASAASTSASNAATSATNAASSATAAAASATAAANAAAALSGSSTTSLAIGTGTKSFTTQSGKQWTAGQALLIVSAANTANFMFGTVTSYSGTALEMSITATGGSGTFAGWVINVSGVRGIQGPAGSLDVGALSQVTPANDDKVVFGDTSSSNGSAWATPVQIVTAGKSALTKSDVGLGNVDNTADASKPVSTATQTALDAKVGAAAAFANDNRLLRSDGTVRAAQASGVTCDDSNNVSGVNNLNIGGALTLAGDPSGALQAATKQYVDNLSAGLDPKPSVLCATTANITLSGEQTIDGVATSASRVLVKNQSTASQNGIYVSSSGAWARAADMDAWLEVPGALVLVEQGSINADTGWVCTADGGGSLGTTAITWAKFYGTGTFQAYSDLLTAIAALSMVADRLIYGTGAGAVALATLTSFARTLLDDADAATARTTLGLGSIATLAEATAAEFRNNTAARALATDKVWAAADPVTLTDGATITPDFNAGINFTVTLGGNRTLANPSNPKAGQSGVILIKQDGTGSRTIAYGTNWKFPGGTAPVLTTTASRTDKLFYFVESSTLIHASLEKDSR